MQLVHMMDCGAFGAHARLKATKVFTGSGCTNALIDVLLLIVCFLGAVADQSGAQPVFCMPAEMLFMLMIRLSWQAVR